MAVEPLILVANPGSASRKYALYKSGKLLSKIHVEYESNNLIATITKNNNKTKLQLRAKNLSEALSEIVENLSYLKPDIVAVRIVAPSAHFLEDRLINENEIHKLKSLENVAPLHIGATLNEIKSIKKYFADVAVVGISDSKFHANKPDYAWNYGIDLQDADTFDIKRFGYHGISLESVSKEIKNSKFDLESKTVICHIGSGVSVSAIYNGNSIETTMGYSPLEGLIMSTRSGTLDFSVGLAYSKLLKIEPIDLLKKLNNSSGLLGISGKSPDIRDLIEASNNNDYRADLALSMYIYKLRQAVGSMASVLNGIESLIFTGTVGQRSSQIRSRVISGLEYLNLALDEQNNVKCNDPESITAIHPRTRTKTILVVPTKEESVMARRARQLVKNL